MEEVSDFHPQTVACSLTGVKGIAASLLRPALVGSGGLLPLRS
jgi:hypothetical protein